MRVTIGGMVFDQVLHDDDADVRYLAGRSLVDLADGASVKGHAPST